MGDCSPSSELLLSSVRESAGKAKVSMEGLPASPEHIEVYDLLCEMEGVGLEGVEGLLFRLKDALQRRPVISKLVSVEFAGLLPKETKGRPIQEEVDVVERMLISHGAIDIEDLERQTGSLVEQVTILKEELSYLRKRLEVAVRISNVFVFTSIILGLLLVISGLASDYLSVDWGSIQTTVGSEELP